MRSTLASGGFLLTLFVLFSGCGMFDEKPIKANIDLYKLGYEIGYLHGLEKHYEGDKK